MTGACSALQDWDGLVCFQYAWSHRIVRSETEYSTGSGYFDTLTNPVKRLSDYITWFLFIRGDVLPLPPVPLWRWRLSPGRAAMFRMRFPFSDLWNRSGFFRRERT